jgi:hypothetical protein
LCKDRQQLFIRRDRLDAFQYRNAFEKDSPFTRGTVTRKDANGAALSFTDDFTQHARSATVNAYVAYVLASHDLFDVCDYPKGADPFAFNPSPDQPLLVGYAVAPWISAQGTLTNPTPKKENNSVQAGLDLQSSFSGGIFGPATYGVISPYYQTDLRGRSSGEGVKAAIEPFNPDVHLGGFIGVPSPYFDWYWAFRTEADVLNINAVGVTGLKRGTHEWFGATARLHVMLFRDRSKVEPLSTAPVPEDILGRIYGDATLRDYYDASTTHTAFTYSVEVGYTLTPSGYSSVSLAYNAGKAKETFVRSDQLLARLNFRY